MTDTFVRRVLVLGGGTAGLLAAIALKTKLPGMKVTVLHSTALGIIGVGEGTTLAVPKFLHGQLAIPPGDFLREVRPTYKLGLKFLWGPRPYFNYTFDSQFNGNYLNLSREPGFYCDDSVEYASLASAMMTHNRAFVRDQNGLPSLYKNHAYHFENASLVNFLEVHASKIGVIFCDDTVKTVEKSDQGVKSLICTSGRRFEADLYVDCSGFESLLLGKTLGEPFDSFKSSLFCDRAVVGGWDRTADEAIKPYTTCESMDSGWCWRIDHEKRINRGYVYSSEFVSDEQASIEFSRKNPRVTKTRVVKFMSGAYRRSWVKNVVAVGNALGFVEPLEATAIGGICQQAGGLSQALFECGGRVNAQLVQSHNKTLQNTWSEIRDFLAVHYKFNTRLDTEFWRAARSDVEIGEAAEYVDYFQSCGPGRFWMNTLVKNTNIFGGEGYLCMMVGMKVPYRNQIDISERERQNWETNRQKYLSVAIAGYSMEESLKLLRQPNFPWDPNLYNLFMP